MVDPCCGSSLRRGTKLIAYIDMGVAVIQAFFSILFVILVIGNYEDVRETFDQDKEDFPQLAALFDLTMGSLIVIFGLASIYFFAMFFLARFLFHAADKRDYTKLSRWYNISLILVLMRSIFYVSGIIFSNVLGAFGIFGLVYSIYCLWIVRALLRKISYCAYWEFVGETTWLSGGPKYVYVGENV
jgi:Na+/proline symporter